MSDTAAMPRKVCLWIQDSEGAWETQCGQTFEVTSGTPSENGFKFCFYCGGELEQVEYADDDGGEE